MGNIKDLLEVNHSVYSALKNKNDIKANINGYEFIGYKHDTKSDHGGIAYYNPEDKSVIISHRGSATLKDWFVNNPKIAIEMLGKPIETMADVSAMRFTNNILEKLDRGNNEIDQVLMSSHSKGGRESQKSLIEVVDNLNLKASALTFNSAPCLNPSGNEYDHVNLRLSGSGSKFYNSDLVSILGKQLGENYNVNSSQVKNPIQAHSLKSFDLLDNKNFMNDDIEKIFEHIKSGKSYMEYESISVQNDYDIGSNKKNTIYSLGGVETSGKDKMENDKTFLGEKIEDLKIVRVIKDIENYEINGNSLVLNKNNETDSIRNTTHFTLNSVVSDHAYGSFSDAKYAVIGDLQDTVNNNKIHGISPADTYFWNGQDGLKINNPIMVMPENDKNIEKYSDNFKIIEYKLGDTNEDSFKNLNNAVKGHFENEKLPFYQVDMWSWSNGNHGMITENERLNVSKNLGVNNVLSSVHNGSIDEQFESINSSIKVLGNYLDEVKDSNDIKNLSFSFGHEIEILERQSKELLDKAKEIQPHSVDYYKDNVVVGLQDFKEAWGSKIEELYPENNMAMPPPIPLGSENNMAMPPPIPLEESVKSQKESNIISDDAERGTTVSLVDAYDKVVNKVTGKDAEPDSSLKAMAREALTFDKVDVAKIATWNTIEHIVGAGAVSTGVKAGILAHELYKGSEIVEKEVKKEIESNLFADGYKEESVSGGLAENLNKINHFDDDFIQKREIRFFQDQEDAVKFSKENFQDIQILLETHARNSGYESTTKYVADSPYFNNADEEKIERALQNKSDKDLNNIYEAMALYSADSIVYDLNYFKDSQQNIEENYSTAEMYIFLSDENSQCIVVKDNMFMDDDKSKMGAELDAKVFDKAEQVEEYLEANESMLQSKISQINLIDMRSNPNIAQIKAFAQGKLNHIKEEISELKTLHSATVTPLGEAHNNLIMVDTKNSNLYSISKNKLVGHDIDIDDILKTSKNNVLDLFNNGEKVEVKDLYNGLHNANDNGKIKVKDKNLEKGLDLDI